MRSILRLLWVPLLALGGGLFYGMADEPLVPPNRGTVLILQRDRTWEGDIVRKGSQYIVRKKGDPIGEIRIPKDKVVALCRDWDDAYLFMKSQANLRDADERIRLARFFLTNNVLPISLVEINEALKLRPQDDDAKRLRTYIEKEIANPSPPPGQPVAPLRTPLVQDSGLAPETVASYTTRAQPILLRYCAACHSPDRASKFQLYRSHPAGQNAAVQRSLVSILAQIDVEQPLHSPLLLKASTPHGNQMRAPFRTRLDPAFKTLRDWVQQVVIDNPHLGLDEPPSRKPSAAHNIQPKAAGDRQRPGKEASSLAAINRDPPESSPPNKNSAAAKMPPQASAPDLTASPASSSPRSPGTSQRLKAEEIKAPPPTDQAPLPPAVSPPQSQSRQPALPADKQTLVKANGPQLAPTPATSAGSAGFPHRSMKLTPVSVTGPGFATPSPASERQAALPPEASAPLRLVGGVVEQALPPSFRAGSVSDGPSPAFRAGSVSDGPIERIESMTLFAPPPPLPQTPNPEPRGDPWSAEIFNQYMPSLRR